MSAQPVFYVAQPETAPQPLSPHQERVQAFLRASDAIKGLDRQSREMLFTETLNADLSLMLDVMHRLVDLPFFGDFLSAALRAKGGRKTNPPVTRRDIAAVGIAFERYQSEAPGPHTATGFIEHFDLGLSPSTVQRRLRDWAGMDPMVRDVERITWENRQTFLRSLVEFGANRDESGEKTTSDESK